MKLIIMGKLVVYHDISVILSRELDHEGRQKVKCGKKKKKKESEVCVMGLWSQVAWI